MVRLLSWRPGSEFRGYLRWSADLIILELVGCITIAPLGALFSNRLLGSSLGNCQDVFLSRSSASFLDCPQHASHILEVTVLECDFRLGYLGKLARHQGGQI